MPSMLVCLYNTETGRSGMTDEEGRFSIGGLPLGKLDAFLSVPGTYTRQEFKSVVEIGSYGETADVNLKYSGPDGIDLSKCVSGHVIDAADNPVADAIIAFQTTDDGWSCRGTTSDASGNFAAELPDDVNEAYLQATAANATSKLEGPVAKGARNITLKLFAGGMIEGSVIDTEGRPVAGVIVTAESERESSNLAQFREFPAGNNARTSSQGCFRFGPLFPQTYPINVYLNGSEIGPPLASTSVSVQEGRVSQTRLVVDASALASLEGVVTIDGKPGTGLPVSVGSGSPSVTDTDGRYHAFHVHPGVTRVSVGVLFNRWMAEPARSEQEIVLEAGGHYELNFDLHSGNASAEGVVTVGGRPQPHATVTFTPLDPEMGKPTEVTANQDGCFNVIIQEGNYSVSAAYESLSQTTEAQISAGTPARLDFNLIGGVIEGVLLGLKTGERAYVIAVRGTIDAIEPSLEALAALGNQVAGSVEVDINGPFRLDNLQQGEYTIAAIAGPADRALAPADVTAALQTSRFAAAYAGVTPGQPANVELALP
jgi:hypothetical protein